MRALIIGLGSIGTRHYNNLVRLGIQDLGVVRTRNLPPPQELMAKPLKTYASLPEALTEAWDLVVIATPSSQHVEPLKEALKRGIHVYCEKPVGHLESDLPVLESLLKTQRDRGTVVQVGCHMRFHPGLEWVKKLLDEKRLGQVQSVVSEISTYFPDWHRWEDYRTGYAARSDLGGGVILTLIHEIDYLQWFFGKPETIHAEGGKLSDLEIDVEDTAFITYALPGSQAPIQLRMDFWRKPDRRSVKIIGSEGELSLDLLVGQGEFTLRSGKKESFSVPPGFSQTECHYRCMEDFLKSIKTKSKPRVDLVSGIDALKTALAAKKQIG